MNLNKMGLIKKITVLIICIIIIPFVLLFVAIYNLNTKSIMDATDTELAADLSSLTTQMDKTLDDMEATINSLNYQQEFIYFLDDTNDISAHEKEYFMLELVRSWGNIQQMMPGKFHQLNVYSKNETITDIQNADFTIRPLSDFSGYIGLLPENNIRYGIPQVIYDKEEVAEKEQYNLSEEIKMSVPIYYYVRSVPQYETIGIIELKVYVEVLLNADELNKAFFDETATLPSAMLLDSNGHVVYPVSNRVYSINNVTSLMNENPITIEIDNEKYRAISAACERTGLIRVALTPLDAFSDTTMIALFLYGAVGILGMTLIILIIRVVIRRVLSRLVTLDKALVTMGDGQFNLLEEDLIDDEVSSIKKHFNIMTLELEEAIQQKILKENAAKNAELRALQSQISPHFLYNTLNSIRMKLEVEEQEELGDIVTALGDLYKYTIHWNSPVVPLSDEWAHIENYIAVMSCRLADDFFFDLEIDPDTQMFYLPKMTLQPIVENSFSHGFKGVEAPWYLSIKAKMKEDKLIITIQNNGQHIEESKLGILNNKLNDYEHLGQILEGKNSIGLTNVVQRIVMFNGSNSKIKISNIAEGGVEIKLTIGHMIEEKGEV